jgi:phosphopantothenoylcysteine decarboxylase/phosphopantothenate--cysteine ligase
MDGGMWEHPATQANVTILAERGAGILGPAEGHLASGQKGPGRMLEPEDLFRRLRLSLSRGGPLSGRKIFVTAGGTQEPVDPVRVITNRSSGKQGYALAQAALDLGAEVTLISAPTALDPPAGARQIDAATAGDMLDAVLEAAADADALLMAAAVADFRPLAPAQDKLKRREGIPEVRLEAAPDILTAVAQMKTKAGCPRVTVGFAAESRDLIENAREKLSLKKVDLIAANDITAPDSGFSVDTNQVTLLFADGRVEALPQMSKDAVARRILDEVVELLRRS